MSCITVLFVFGAFVIQALSPPLVFAVVPSESVRWSFHPPGSAFFLRPRPDERHSGLVRRFYIHSPDRQPELRAQLGPLTVSRPALAAPPPTPAYIRPSVHVANPRSVVTQTDPDVHYLCHIEVSASSDAYGNAQPDLDSTDYCCYVQTELPHGTLRGRNRIYSVCEVNRRRPYCYASAALPSQLWSPHATYYGPLKPPDLRVKAYFVLLPRQRRNELVSCNSEPPNLPAGAAFRPVQGSPVWLVHGRSSSSKGVAVVREDKDVLLMVPRQRVKPGKKVEVSVKLVNNSNLVEFKLRVKISRDHFTVIDAIVPSGSRPSARHWIVKSRLFRQKQEAEVTARLMDKFFHVRPKKEQTIFDVIFFVKKTKERKHNRVKVDWALLQTRYRDSQVRRSSAAHSFSTEINVGENSLINIVPILKDTDLINTAILDGKKVSFPLKIYSLNRDLIINEVSTGRCTCHSNEGAIVKVEKNCKFVYLDGREKYGGWNISLIVKFSQYTSYIHLRVWVPERKVRLELSDSHLNLIRGWRAPKRSSYHRYARSVNSFRPAQRLEYELPDQPFPSFTRDNRDRAFSSRTNRDSDSTNGKRRKYERRRRNCDKVFQRAQIKVYTRFITHKEDTGQYSRSYRQRYRYLVDSNSWFDVTEMVASQLYVDSSTSTKSIAKVHGRWLVGGMPGQAMLKLSVNGVVIGNISFVVTMQRTQVSDLQVEPITALRCFIKPGRSTDSSVSEVSLKPLNIINSTQTDAFLHMRLFFGDDTVISLADQDLANLPASWDVDDRPNLEVVSGREPNRRLWPQIRASNSVGQTPELSLWLLEDKTCTARPRGRKIAPRTEVVIGGPQLPRKQKPPRRRPKYPAPGSRRPKRPRLLPPLERQIGRVRERPDGIDWRGERTDNAKMKPTGKKGKDREETIPESRERERDGGVYKGQLPPLRPPAVPAPRSSPPPIPLLRHTATPAAQTPVSPRDGPQEDEPGRVGRYPDHDVPGVEKQPFQLPHDGADVLDEEDTTGGQSPTPLEIGMYVLLCIFCVAATVFAVNCGLMLARYQRRRMCRRTDAGKEGPCLSPVYEHGNLVGTREARNWVWLRPPGSGSSSEDKRPLSMASSQLPAHSVANASLPRSCISAAAVSSSSVAPMHSRQERQSIAGLATFQHSSLQPRHYQGDECSIRIVNNPMPIHVDDANAAPSATATAVSGGATCESKRGGHSASNTANFHTHAPTRHSSIASPSSTRSAPPPSFPPPPPPPLASNAAQPPAPPQRTTSCRAASGRRPLVPPPGTRSSMSAIGGGHRSTTVANVHHHGSHHTAAAPSAHLSLGHNLNNASSGSGGSSVASTMRGWDRHLRALPVEQRFAYFNNMKESVA